MRIYERANERWEIERREPAQLVTRRFEHGTLVAEDTQRHASALRAQWEADRTCTRLAAQGFVRAGGEATPALGQAELEAALRANPDDLETYLVYGDWLCDRGDDWGQLIAVQHALETLPRFGAAARRDELAHAETLLMFRLSARLWGSLGEIIHDESTQHYRSELVHATWRWGFVQSASIRDVDEDVLVELVRGLRAAPCAIVLRSLAIHVDAVSDAIDALADAPWPSLATLSLSATAAFDAARLAPIMQHAPRLVRLYVTGTENTDALCEAIARAPIVSQLEHVSVCDGRITRRGVDALSTAPLRSLQSLELGATPAEARARLQHLPNVRVHVDDD